MLYFSHYVDLFLFFLNYVEAKTIELVQPGPVDLDLAQRQSVPPAGDDYVDVAAIKPVTFELGDSKPLDI